MEKLILIDGNSLLNRAFYATPVFTTKDGKLHRYKPQYDEVEMFENEITSFIRCIETGEKLPSNIDYVISTAKIMQGIYDSSELGKEIDLTV